MAEALRFQKELEELKQTLTIKNDEIRQLKNANRELFNAVHECEGVAEEEEDSEF